MNKFKTILLLHLSNHISRLRKRQSIITVSLVPRDVRNNLDKLRKCNRSALAVDFNLGSRLVAPELVNIKLHNLIVKIKAVAYFSDRTIRIVENFDYTELSIVDQLIADFFVLDDTTRSEVFQYLNILKNNHTNPERQKILDKIYQK